RRPLRGGRLEVHPEGREELCHRPLEPQPILRLDLPRPELIRGDQIQREIDRPRCDVLRLCHPSAPFHGDPGAAVRCVGGPTRVPTPSFPPRDAPAYPGVAPFAWMPASMRRARLRCGTADLEWRAAPGGWEGGQDRPSRPAHW